MNRPTAERLTREALRVLAVFKPKIDEVGSLWLVRTPAFRGSDIEDVLFQANLGELMLMAKGGMEPEDIAGVFRSKAKALKLAQSLMW